MWNKWILKKISICLWIAYFNCLSVDDQVQNLEISFVSQCDCCKEGKEEDLDHILCKEDFAKALWNKY